MVLDAALLSTQHYEVRIKGEMEQSRECSSALLDVVNIEKGATGHVQLSSPTYIYITDGKIHPDQFFRKLILFQYVFNQPLHHG